MADKNSKTKTASAVDAANSLYKAASRTDEMMELLKEDKEVNMHKKTATSQLLHDIKVLQEKYWSHKGIENYIKTAKLDRLPGVKSVLDFLRKEEVITFEKRASLMDYLDFEKDIYKVANNFHKLALLDPEANKEGYEVGAEYKTVRRLRVGTKVISAGTIVNIVDVVSDMDGNDTITFSDPNGENYTLDAEKFSRNAVKLDVPDNVGNKELETNVLLTETDN